jgi:2-oxoglutarate ferredoxin oxidoreductase subunit alpha
VSVLAPFPLDQLRDALAGVTKILCVENNAAGQLARLAGCHGIRVDERILKYDGRQFSLDELEGELGKVI